MGGYLPHAQTLLLSHPGLGPAKAEVMKLNEIWNTRTHSPANIWTQVLRNVWKKFSGIMKHVYGKFSFTCTRVTPSFGLEKWGSHSHMFAWLIYLFFSENPHAVTYSAKPICWSGWKNPPPPLTGERYRKMEPKYPESGHCQSILHPLGSFLNNSA